MHRFNYHNRRCHQEAEPQAALSPAERLAHAVCKPLSYPGLTPPEPRFSTSCRSVFERPFPAAEYSVAAVCQHSLTTWLQPVEGQQLASGSHDRSASRLGGHCTQYIVLPDSVNTICCMSDASSGRSRLAQFFPRIVQKSRRLKSRIPARIRLTNTPADGSK